MKLKEIEKLAKKDRFKEAIEACDKLLASSDDEEVDILRTRAYVYARSGDYKSALKDRVNIIDSDIATIRDYYLAADNALSLHDYRFSADLFKKVLLLGTEQNESWFESATYFLLAFVHMNLGEYDEAISNLESATAIDPECAMPLPELGIWNAERLKYEITSRK